MRLRAGLVASLLVLVFAASPVPHARSADEETRLPEDVRQLLAKRGRHSTSVGAPGDGSLEGGVPFPLTGPGFRFGPMRDPHARYGTVEVVQALVHAALAVSRDLPGGELTVHDLSLEHGGPIPHHGSHRAGRDVDVLFYSSIASARSIARLGMPIDPRGRGWRLHESRRSRATTSGCASTSPRTWRCRAGPARGRRPTHRSSASSSRSTSARCCSRTRSSHAPACGDRSLRRSHLPARLSARRSLPLPLLLHRGGRARGLHRHVADVSVAPHGDGAARRRAVLARPRADRPRSAVTTEDEARSAAGAMDPAVEAWLARREAWLHPPHPGRRYCR